MNITLSHQVLLAAVCKQLGLQDAGVFEVKISHSVLRTLRDGGGDYQIMPTTEGLTLRFKPHGPMIDGGKLEFVPEKVEEPVKVIALNGIEYEMGIDVGEDKCCREPHCGGDCTCSICAPDLAARDQELELEAQREREESGSFDS
jgi:hypothetical protein